MIRALLMSLGLSFGPLASDAAGNPTDLLMEVRQTTAFPSFLAWIGETEPSAQETQGLLRGLKDAEDKELVNRFDALEAFVAQNFGSAWVPSLQVNMGLVYRQEGNYSRALRHWEAAWEQTKQASSGPEKKIADVALVNWIRLLTSLGRTEKLAELFEATKTRPLNGVLHTQYYSSRSAYLKMLAHPELSYTCGTHALYAVSVKLQGRENAARQIMKTPSPVTGFSLHQLSEIATGHSVDVEVVERPGGASFIPVPSVVHWRENHYAAILERKGNKFRVLDPTFRSDVWLTAETINEEASGYFIAARSQAPVGWGRVQGEKLKGVFGKGFPNAMGPGDGGECDQCTGICPPGGPNGSGSGGCSTCGPGGGGGRSKMASTSSRGMPIYFVSEPFINLWVQDTPLFYTPGVGPEVEIKLSYKQRPEGPTTSAYDENVFGFGDRWTFGFRSYVQPDGANALHVVDGKRSVQYALGVSGGGDLARDTTSSYPLKVTHDRMDEIESGGVVQKYTLLHSDGSVDEFGYKVANPSTRWFITKKIDPVGNALEFKYEEVPNTSGVVRLKYLIDAAGQTNGFAYNAGSGHPFGQNIISAVTNAFGNVCSFAYNSVGWLSNIVDVAGISSSFGYVESTSSPMYGWMTNLTTPYGTTTFTHLDNGMNNENFTGINRAIIIGTASGGRELYMYRDRAEDAFAYLGLTYSYHPDLVPAVLDAPMDNGFLENRNSFFWGARQYAGLSTTNLASFTTNDYIKGRWRHWLHLKMGDGEDIEQTPNEVSSVLSIEREPSPDPAGYVEGMKTWYWYGQSVNEPYLVGSSMLPQFIARVMPDGETWYQELTRNQFGKVTQLEETYQDANGDVQTRSQAFMFDGSNGIDLITEHDFNGDLVVSNAFNANHQIIKQFDGAYWSTNFYGPNQKLIGQQSPTGLLITNQYYASGASKGLLEFTKEYRIGAGNVIEWLSTNKFTHDKMLVKTHEDERGLIVTNTWDALRRLRSTHYPDGFTTNIYSLTNQPLHLLATKDKVGNWTGFKHNGMGVLEKVTNALGNVTTYGLCNCGAVNWIGDPMGNTNFFTYDNAGRLISTAYPGGSVVTNYYDLLGRLTGVSDGGFGTTNVYNMQGSLISQSKGGAQTGAWLYDIEDRVLQHTDANGVLVTNLYDELSRVLTQTYPDGGVEQFAHSARGMISYTNQIGKVTRFGYDERGRRISETNANTEVIQFRYNAAGDLTNLVDGKLHNTYWKYDSQGRATNKLDHTLAESFRYTYDGDGRLLTRWTPGKGTTSFSHNAAGNLTNVNYPSSADLTFWYDANNRLTNMVDAAGTTAFAYTGFGALASENGPWADDIVTFGYNSGRMRASVTVQQPSAAAWTNSYLYDASARMTNITSPAGAFGYQYDATAKWSRKKVAYPNGSYVTNAFDSVARLLSTSLKNSANSALNTHSYIYNTAHQRTKQTFTAGNYVDYGYDSAGQVTNVVGKEAGGVTNRLHERLAYGYDAAGNLATRTNNNLLQTFTVNDLNELTASSRSGAYTVSGGTIGGANSVTVNANAGGAVSATMHLDGSFARTNVTLNNGNNNFVAIATDSSSRKATNTVAAYLPTSVTFQYDANGNLTSDGQNGYVYDDENQLLQITRTNEWRTRFAYDGKMRRRILTEEDWVNAAWTTNKVIQYIYEGNLIIEERHFTATGSLAQRVTYTRGLDLSGSLQGAGGIGGLLARSPTQGTGRVHAYYHADGNGNVTAMMNPNHIVVARYNYDPFGRKIAESGPLAAENAYQWSSKEFHVRSGLSYYLYRYYSADLQRWINRDPLGEGGFSIAIIQSDHYAEMLEGPSLLRFVSNDAVNHVDAVGNGKLPAKNKDREGHKKKKKSDKHSRAQGHGGRTKPNMPYKLGKPLSCPGGIGAAAFWMSVYQMADDLGIEESPPTDELGRCPDGFCPVTKKFLWIDYVECVPCA